jgi:hypothetical protein
MVNEAQVIAESRALLGALSVVEGTKSPQEVTNDVRSFKEVFHREPNIEGAVIDTALWVICGRAEDFEVPRVTLRDRSLEDGVFQTLAEIWMQWAQRGAAAVDLPALVQLDVEGIRGSMLHRMALQQWKLAIEALVRSNTDEARKRFRRALRIGSEYGTPSNPAIHWTYAASLFHERELPSAIHH